jgi:hypothetical protein
MGLISAFSDTGNPAFSDVGTSSFSDTPASTSTDDSGVIFNDDGSQTGPGVTVTAKKTNSFKIQLEVVGPGGGKVIFEVSAPLVEARQATYEGYNITHLPTSIWAYKNTNARHFTITGKLVSRNGAEAKVNVSYLHLIRSWILPGFGTTGTTPPIVFLTAYNNINLTSIPCIILSYNWTFTDEVDYIFDAAEPMPVIGVLSVELEEAYSPEQITDGVWKMQQPTTSSLGQVGVGSSLTTDTSVALQSMDAFSASSSFPGLASAAGIASMTSGVNSSLMTVGSQLTDNSASSIASLPSFSTPLNSPQISDSTNYTDPSIDEGIANGTIGTADKPLKLSPGYRGPSPEYAPPDSFGRSTALQPPTFTGVGGP